MRTLSLTLLFPALAACAATEQPTPKVDKEPAKASPANGSSNQGAVVNASMPGANKPEIPQERRKEIQERRPKPPMSLASFERDIWHSKAFRKRLAESYASEVDIEPSVDQEDLEAMRQVFEVIAGEKKKPEGDAAKEGSEKPAKEVEDDPKQAEMEEAARIKRLQKAEGLLKAILAKDKGKAKPAVEFTLANIYLQLGRAKDAIPRYQAAIEESKNFRRAHSNLAQAQFQEKLYQDAILSFGNLVRLGGGDALVYGMMGVCHTNVNNPIGAEAAFRRAIMFDPSEINWKLGLADSYFKQQRFADAASLFEELIRLKPNNATYWMAQGDAYAQLGKGLQAAENYEVVDALGGSTYDSLNNLGDIYATNKIYDRAVLAYGRAMEKKPTASPERVIRAAKYLVGSGAYAEATDLATKIEKVSGSMLTQKQRTDLLHLRARLAVAQGQNDKEAGLLKQVIDIDPMDGDALILLGRYQDKKGNAEEAIRYFERAANIKGHEANAKLGHAQVLVRQSQYAKAIPLIRAAQQINPRPHVQKYLTQVMRAANVGTSN